MTKKRIIIVTVLLVAILAAAYFLYLSEFMKVDRCLDAGGRWNSELKQCEFER